MKARPNRYSISLAPTGRARCRACKGLVARGEVRIVTHATVKPGRGTCFVRHATCVDAAFAAAVLAVHGDGGRVAVARDVSAEAVEAVRAALK